MYPYDLLGLLAIPILIGWLVCAGFCGTVAEEKGYSSGMWIFGGLLFGPLALIAVAGLPDKKLRNILMLQSKERLNVETPHLEKSVAKEMKSEEAQAKPLTTAQIIALVFIVIAIMFLLLKALWSRFM